MNTNITEADSINKDLELGAMNDLLNKFTTTELADTIDLIMLGPSEAESNQPGYGFARYAARLFAEVGASQIRGIAAANELGVIRLSRTNTFWMRFAGQELAQEDIATILAAEAAMNRLLFVKEAFDVQQETTIFTEADCSLADVHFLESIVTLVPNLLAGEAENPLLELFGTQGAKGGEWDLRTRFAYGAEALRLPYRFTYQFDCHAQDGLFEIHYLAPLPSWMPQYSFNPQTSQWQDISQGAGQMASRYALSLGVVMLGLAFGASVGVRRVHIAAHRHTLDSDPIINLYVDRLPFISDVLAKIQAKDLGWMETLLNSVSLSDPSFDATIKAQHREASSDTRLLPEGLQALLCATTVAELDVLSDLKDDPWDSVHAAYADREDAPLAAIAVLEDVAAQADAAVANLPAGIQPLYCGDMAARAAISLVKVPGQTEETRYVRYSDAGFQARTTLCDLYRNMNEPQRAFQQAQRCIELAPSSVTGYIDAANACADQDKFAEAIPYLEQALLLSMHYQTIAFAYYRLAFALWQTGRHRAGLACYVLCRHFGSGREDVVQQEMNALLSEMGIIPGVDEVPITTVEQARDVAQAEGVPLAPSSHLRQVLASALIPLVDAGICNVSAPLVNNIAGSFVYRDELYAVANSLHGYQ